MEAVTARKGDWVEVRRIVLDAGQRSVNIPPDTAKVPYAALIKGLLLEDAKVGDAVTIETIIGRRLTGILMEVNPPYGHDFGRSVPELLNVGKELQAILVEEREP